MTSPSGAAVFADLGSGTGYGSRVYTAADGGFYRDIALNAAAGGQFAIGGAVTSLSYATGGGAVDELLFGNYTSAFNQFLVINPIPEPSTGALVGLGLLALAMRRRRDTR